MAEGDRAQPRAAQALPWQAAGLGCVLRRLCRRTGGRRPASSGERPCRPQGDDHPPLCGARQGTEQCRRSQVMAGTSPQAGRRMSGTPPNILGCIGNTRLLPLRQIRPVNGARILLKLENENPTGSMKDRMALAMIEAAEADCRLKPGGCVVEYTGGSTGVSLSLVCAVKGYSLHIVTSDAFAREKLDHMKILGAKLRIVRSDSGRMTEKLTRDMVEAARAITADT